MTQKKDVVAQCQIETAECDPNTCKVNVTVVVTHSSIETVEEPITIAIDGNGIEGVKNVGSSTPTKTVFDAVGDGSPNGTHTISASANLFYSAPAANVIRQCGNCEGGGDP